VPEHPKDNKKQRYELLSEDDFRRKLPAIEYCDDLLVAFRDSGMISSGGMGAVPLSWLEVNAMNDGGCYGLSAWDKRQIMKMSVAYCSMSHKATKEIPPPYKHETTEEERKAFGLAQLKAMERIEAANAEVMKSKKPLR